MITKRCEQCGEEFKSYPSKKARFCSRRCMGKWRSENRRVCKRGENHYMWKPKTVKICEQCGEEYEIIKCRENKSRFCSRKCHDEYNRGERNPNWKGGNVVKICKQCGEEYEIFPVRSDESQFCSHKCKGEWQSENACGENNPRWGGGKAAKICEQCGEEYGVQASLKDKSRFCSTKCKGKWMSDNQSGENSPVWKGGISFEPYCEKFNELFKEKIREKFGRVCFLCPKTEEENSRKLSVHHVNYDKDCLCDDAKCAFVPLCNTCHTKTNFNRDYWENLIMEKLEVI